MTQEKRQYRAERWAESENQERLWGQRLQEGMPLHVAPFSTLIAAMGDHWHPGCHEAVRNMAEETFRQGYQVCLYEEQDVCFRPYDAMGIMRNQAYMRALREGWEYLLFVDNDMQPEPNTLTRLLARRVPVVAPLVRYWDRGDHGLLSPTVEAGKGLAMVGSVVLSLILFRVAVFFPWALGGFWENPLGADEGYHFWKLAQAGHYPFLDTDVEALCVSAPHFPLDVVGRRTVQDLERTRAPGEGGRSSIYIPGSKSS